MARVKGSSSKDSSSKSIRPALTPEGEEMQMIALATNLAKKQLMEGTASSQMVCHYLKLGSARERLERERLEEENKLLRAKTEALQSQKDYEQRIIEAIDAMRTYSGQGRSAEDDHDEDDYDYY